MFPVFSLVLDEDVPSDIALIYPELYKDLAKVGKTIKLQSQLFVYDRILLRQYYFSSYFSSSIGKVTFVQDFLYLGSDQYIPR